MDTKHTRRTRRTALACTAITIAGIALTAAALPRHVDQGLSFVLRSSSGIATTPAPTASASDTRIQFLNGSIRFVSPSDTQSKSRGNAYGEGTYVLLSAPDRRMLLVMPSRKQYIEVGMAALDTLRTGVQLAGAASTATATPIGTTVVSNVSVSGSSLGSGGMVNGFDTKHYSVTMDFTLTDQQAGAEKRSATMHSVEEFWVTDALKDVPDPTVAMARFFGGKTGFAWGAGGSLGDLLRRRADAQQKLFSGLPIRSTSRTTETVAGGGTRENIGSMDILDLKRVDLDPALFRVPEGYTKLSLEALMADVGAQFKNALNGLSGANSKDSTSLVDAAKKAVEDSTKAAMADKAKKKLGGLLRRP